MFCVRFGGIEPPRRSAKREGSEERADNERRARAADVSASASPAPKPVGASVGARQLPPSEGEAARQWRREGHSGGGGLAVAARRPERRGKTRTEGLDTEGKEGNATPERPQRRATAGAP